ncbi:hypothetical protein A3197_16475 [Candidatus Thiodiazotropha endoloripes]|nr:hypothetical protein A3197_16475 [Candidatus Thiodiazotropha endoloripes]
MNIIVRIAGRVSARQFGITEFSMMLFLLFEPATVDFIVCLVPSPEKPSGLRETKHLASIIRGFV